MITAMTFDEIGDVDQFRDDHCGQLCCAAALIFRDYGLDVLRAAA